MAHAVSAAGPMKGIAAVNEICVRNKDSGNKDLLVHGRDAVKLSLHGVCQRMKLLNRIPPEFRSDSLSL